MRLPNYLLTYRKRSGLSQREIGYLLGARYGTQVSRYERFTRIPPLPTAIALCVIYRQPLDALFTGTIRTAEQDTDRRVAQLVRHLDRMPQTAARDRKLAALRAARERT